MSRMCLDLIGMRFGRLKVLRFSHFNEQHDSFWICRCDCGKNHECKGGHLKSGRTKSCGCLAKETSRRSGEEAAHFIHGMEKSRLYHVWESMKKRCEYSKNENFKHYGGRGIAVCDEWYSFAVFSKWALSHGYRDDLTIDRMNVNGNYEPSNCRWATWKQQANNRREKTAV